MHNIAFGDFGELGHGGGGHGGGGGSRGGRSGGGYWGGPGYIGVSNGYCLAYPYCAHQPGRPCIPEYAPCYDMALGDINFSSTQALIDQVNASFAAQQAYQSCAVPAAVAAYNGGAYVNGIWNQTLDFALEDVEAYETCGDNKTNTLAALVFGTEQTAPPTAAQVSTNLQQIADINAFNTDISTYKNYWVTRYAQQNNTTSVAAVGAYYQQYFSGSVNGVAAMNAVQTEIQRRQSALQAQSQVTQSTLKVALGTGYLNFYSQTLPAYMKSFSSADQQTLQNFFVTETPLDWTSDEFVTIGNILKPIVSATDFGTFLVGILGEVSTYTFTDPDGSMTTYENRVTAFDNAAVTTWGSAAPTNVPGTSAGWTNIVGAVQAVQSSGISLPKVAAVGLASYLIWMALK